MLLQINNGSQADSELSTESMYMSTGVEVPIFIRRSPKSHENGDPGVPKIIMKIWGPGVPNLGGPRFHMTPCYKKSPRVC